MELKTLKAKNVFRFDKVDVDFKDTTLILGNTNGDFSKSNGVGKSAIPELVVFGLFGKTLRGQTNISKNHSGKYYIELEADNVKIIRDHKSVKLFVDGKEMIGRKKETQNMINNYLKINLDIFKYAGIFSSFTNFFELSDSEKKDLLLDILDIKFLDKVYDNVHKDFSKLKENSVELLVAKLKEETKGFDEARGEYNKLKKEVESKTKIERILSKQLEYNRFYDNYSSELRSLKDENDNLKIKAKDIKENKEKIKLKDINKIREKLDEEKQRKAVLENEMKIINARINRLKDEDKCPLCLSKLSNKEKLMQDFEYDYKDKKGEVNIIDGLITKDNYELQLAETAKQTLDELKMDYTSAKNTYNKNKEKIALLEKKISDLKEEFKEFINVKIEEEVSMADIKEAQIKFTNAHSKVMVLKNKKDDLEKYLKQQEEYIKDIAELEDIKKVFSKDGIKQFIISKVLGFLEVEVNEAIIKVLNDIYLKIDVDFETEKRNMLNITIVRNDVETNFNELSSGQKAVIQIVFQIAISKLYEYTGNTSLSVVFFDEVFDPLDVHNSHQMMDVLKVLGKTAFVISHKEYVKEHFDNIMIVESDGKNSWIKH